ncbi:MAG TPA: ABC transporter permease [Acidimicrobiia bacterium]|nr:ABC transporter permease [Acidimicrobiia bacterium]
MDEFIRLTIFGLVAAAIYFVAASGLVLTYTTSGIFNFAHGAIGMVAAFTYWELRFNPDGPGLPTPLALFLVLGVLAPLFGVLVERVLIRNLQGASLATTLVVTVGMLAALIGLAQTFWPPESRVVRGFFDPNDVQILGVNVPWHRIITVIVAIGVAVGLRILLYRTRMGIAMRAVVDNRTLAGLNGAQAHRVSALSWAIGSSLAALAGILIAPELGLEQIALTLLVVNAYAAAMVGRLRSLPLTVVGAIILGLLVQYVPSYLPRLRTYVFWGGEVFDKQQLPKELSGLPLSIPILMLFVVLLVLPVERLGGWQARAGRSIRVPSLGQSLLGAAALVAVVFGVSGFLSDQNLGRVGQGLALGLIVLSLVPLTGYAAQISLAQMTLAGLGAVVMAKVAAEGSPIGLLAAMAIAGAVGGLLALPALRLRGLYLALSTLAIAVLADYMFFTQQRVFSRGSLEVARLDLGIVDFKSDRSYVILLAIAYALAAVFVLALRRGAFGRRLLAMKDSPAACATLGLDLTRTKFTVFVVSAALAGLGGALYGGLRGSVSANDFAMVQGLPILLLAVLGGIATASGALVGGLFFALITIISQEYESFDWLVLVAPGLVGITLGHNPDGVVPDLADRSRRLLTRLRSGPDPAAVERRKRGALVATLDADVPFGAPLGPEQVEALDARLGTEEVTPVGAARD